jgi:hypothetical protein
MIRNVLEKPHPFTNIGMRKKTRTVAGGDLALKFEGHPAVLREMMMTFRLSYATSMK